MAYTDEFGNIFGTEEDFDYFGDAAGDIFYNTADDPWTGGDVFDWAGANEDLRSIWTKYGKSGLDLLKGAFTKNGQTDWRAVATAAGGVAPIIERLLGGSKPPVTGYQGGIPELAAVRQQVPQAYDPNRRPGSGGQRYFTDVQYVPKTGDTAADALAAAQTAAGEQATGLAALNQANTFNRPPTPYMPSPSYQSPYSNALAAFPNRYAEPTTASQVNVKPPALTPKEQEARMQEMLNTPRSLIDPMEYSGSSLYTPPKQYLPKAGEGTQEAYFPPVHTMPVKSIGSDEIYASLEAVKNMARGGIVGLQDGGFVVPADVVSHLGNGSSRAGLAHLQKRGAVPIQGRGDGMSDSNRTMINGRQPAAVADGEAYLPPDRVQKMGGPERLYSMMDRIRKDRTGTTQQGRQINPNKYLG